MIAVWTKKDAQFQVLKAVTQNDKENEDDDGDEDDEDME